MEDLHFTTAGNFPSDELRVSPRRHQCGHIKDGICFAFGGEGGWVMAFQDLKALYEAACAVRSASPSDINRES